MTRSRAIISSVLLVAALAACGDAEPSAVSDSVAATPVTDAIPDTTAASNPVDTSVPTATESTLAPSGPGTGSAFCNYQTELNDLDTPFDNADATAADFQEFYTTTVPEALARSAALAPDELKDDIAKVNEGITALGAALAANGWDAAAAYSDPAMQAVLSDTSFEAASTNIDDYCGF